MKEWESQHNRKTTNRLGQAEETMSILFKRMRCWSTSFEMWKAPVPCTVGIPPNLWTLAFPAMYAAADSAFIAQVSEVCQSCLHVSSFTFFVYWGHLLSTRSFVVCGLSIFSCPLETLPQDWTPWDGSHSNWGGFPKCIGVVGSNPSPKVFQDPLNINRPIGGLELQTSAALQR